MSSNTFSALMACLLLAVATAFMAGSPAAPAPAATCALPQLVRGHRVAAPFLLPVKGPFSSPAVTSSRRPVATLEWDNARAEGGVTGLESALRVASTSPLLALTALALASIRAPVVGVAAGLAYGVVAAVQALRRASAERVFFMCSLATVVMVGVVGGYSFGTALFGAVALM
ncbi:hypothetical protein JKP88DRAFT_218224, partial [Tribonema minus]